MGRSRQLCLVFQFLLFLANSAKRASFLTRYSLEVGSNFPNPRNGKPETRSGFRYSYPADFNYLR